ncbi:uncharacterized protein LOC144705754 isoform X1 [Wolffia australiana]
MEEKIFDEHLNWGVAGDYDAPLNVIAVAPPPENLVLRELIGRLGSICNSNELPCHFAGYAEGSKLSLCSSPEDSAEKVGARKRKAPAKGKTKSEEQNGKRSKSEESADDGGGSAAAPPKQDYIHVRARRGQATDSHSLAERVRREKISQRMKFLQDLVPGCNKVMAIDLLPAAKFREIEWILGVQVTGKALMLDEIINYVQSLQRQVEFLSMKLATVNPRVEFGVENVFPKITSFASPESCSPAFSFAAAEAHAGGGINSSAGFVEASSLLPAFWEDDLHSVVQLGALSSQSFHGDGNGVNSSSLPASHMTIRL